MAIALLGNTGTPTESPILASHGWHRFASQVFTVTITNAAGTAVDISGYTLQWLLLRQGGDAESRAYINKTTAAGITVINDASDNIATFTVDDSEYATVPAGYFYHELWDRGNDVLLAYGDAVLLPGTQDEA